jgi:peptidoglycan/xylan/chitin deacetylase (PgdA/CDA1 family)
LGNHTHTHPLASYWIAGAARTGREIDACTAALRSAGAAPPFHFRPPAGQKSFFLHRELARRGLDLVLWSARGYDTQVRDPAHAVQRIQKNITPGAIILLHESGRPGSPRLEVLARLLAHLTADGYAAVVPGSEQLDRR